MKDAILVTVRLKSTRLLKKVLLEVDGKPILKYLTDRLRFNFPEMEIIICTSTNSEDYPLVEFARKENLAIFLGAEEDVIGRYYSACKEYSVDRFYIVYGDEPFTDIDTVKENFLMLETDKVMWIKNDSLPEGTYGYGMTFKGIDFLNKNKPNDSLEVWQIYASSLAMEKIEYKTEYRELFENIRLTIDYPEDFVVFKRIIDVIGENHKTITLNELVEVYESDNLYAINGKRIEDYKARILSQGTITQKIQ